MDMARFHAGGMVLVLAVGCTLLTVHERHRWRERLSPLWVRTVHDVPYGPHPENRLDILQRRWGAAPVDRPAVLIFHGGSWIGGSRQDTLVRDCHPYLNHGYVVANVEYRKGAIAPAVDDAILALRWFFAHAAAYGADRNKIVVTGESAGAHLALMAAFRSGEQPAAVVNFYGPSDLVRMLDRPAIRAVLPLYDIESAAKALSPVTYVGKGSPRVFSIQGTADGIVPPAQTTLLSRALRAAGVEASECYINGGKHGLSIDQQQEAYRAVFDFLQRRGVLDR